MMDAKVKRQTAPDFIANQGEAERVRRQRALETLLSVIVPGHPDDAGDDKALLEEMERRHA